MEYPVRYLESFDSIRAGWQPGPNVPADEARAQACIETMVSLAFGRDIVIQQSYALDSFAFQLVLTDVVQAYERVLSEPSSTKFWANENLPIRLHLYGHKSFRGAAADVFRRIGRGEFHSQMYPDLTGEPEALVIADEIFNHGRDLRLYEFFAGDGRSELFRNLWAWFGESVQGEGRRIVEPVPEKALNIDLLLAPLLSDESVLLAGPKGEELVADPVLGEVVTALRTLAKSSGRQSPFKSRSPLYSNRPWADSGGPSAGQMVGDTLPLVQEVVSTLYNRTTVASIGRASAYYSTPMSSPEYADDLLKVQELALASAAAAKAGTQPKRQPGAYEGLPANPPMEIRINSKDGVRGSFNRKLGPGSGNTVSAFESILQLRQEPKWQKGIEAIDASYYGGDLDGYVSAVHSHLDVVAQGVGRHLVVRTGYGGQTIFFQDPSQKGAMLSAAIASGTGMEAQAIEPFVSLGVDLGLGWIAERRAQGAAVKDMRQAWTEVVIPPRRRA
ncbi:hypothetical protein [Pseudarthrobacter sp. NamE5]|uniref:hypothetical protein n=1 Tax=Pseudarthrobacter sp. NamE5 TaxID=2576839 RepID=UPI00110AB6AD|nr:hypothetical protein [Pseudarthrobacter sp. NamE5]TLM87195.1 hypothetical protein FDW84_05205 [Pseudarthrobacter sp. NamE5]